MTKINGTANGKDGKHYPLTLKQQAFCYAYLECEGNASAAYKVAYNAENMMDKTVTERASQLMDNGNVAAMIDELQVEARERHVVTMDSLSKRLDKAFKTAETQENSGQMTQATMGQAKLHGLLVDKTEEVTKPAAEMTDAELADESHRIQLELIQLMTGDELAAELVRVRAEVAQIEEAQKNKLPAVTTPESPVHEGRHARSGHAV